MTTIHDNEFGDISVRRVRGSRRISIRVTPKRALSLSAPFLTPVFMMRQMIDTSRPKLRRMLIDATPERPVYSDGDAIGKSHRLQFVVGSSVSGKITKNIIIITHPRSLTTDSPAVQTTVIDTVAKALRKEAKSYLPRRLEHLAQLHGYRYETVRFSHASGRWGSCSSKGTISLNIALMNIPFELIDYVLIHELCHTAEMNHSPRFWARVEIADPEYKAHKKALKNFTPTV